jgi:uncharacterized phiE125 gp8 family phage protein
VSSESNDYGLQVIAPPGELPLSLDETKVHLRVTHDDEDTLIESLIAAAVERFEKETRISLIDTEWAFVLDGLPHGAAPIKLPRYPLVSVDEISYTDASGETIVLATEEYVVTTTRQPGLVRPSFRKSWPLARRSADSVRIEFTAGYGSAACDVPPLAKSALLLIVGALHEYREDLGDRHAYPLPIGAQRIMQLYDVGDELTEYGQILHGV